MTLNPQFIICFSIYGQLKIIIHRKTRNPHSLYSISKLCIIFSFNILFIFHPSYSTISSSNSFADICSYIWGQKVSEKDIDKHPLDLSISVHTGNIFSEEFHQDRWGTFQSSMQCQTSWRVSRWRTEGWPSGFQGHQKVGGETSWEIWRLDVHCLH